MFTYLRKHKTPVLVAFFLSLILVFGISIGYLTSHVFSEDGKFKNFTEEIFRREAAGSSLTLHYTLAFPEKLGIHQEKASLGTVDTDMAKTNQLCREYEEKLKSFTYSRLSRENQLTLDMLLLYFHTQQQLGENRILEEILGPGLGIQAQLPVLLAEYAFYTDQDITDYLNLLVSIRPYFRSILEFEREKAEAGYFMSDATLDRILDQCGAFIRDPDSNYIQEIFSRKLRDYGKLSKEAQGELNARHKEILAVQVIPAYQELMSGLEKLRGAGKSSRGLACFPGGKEYYLYLLQSQVGAYVPVKRMEERLSQQLMEESRQISEIMKAKPALLGKLTRGTDLPEMEPKDIMETLRQKMTGDFEEMTEAEYEIRYVHKSMEDYLSPAFYLTPPLDTGSPNVIYINRRGKSSNLELFTTLAHEGFPGHLYQTLSFARREPSYIRYLISSSGYVEGWATYVESFAYDYAASLLEDEDAVEFMRVAGLNRSVNLCIYSLLDLGIHYHGWDASRCAAFLRPFGIHDVQTVNKIFQYIVETPANYLKYYWGYLSFLDLRKEYEDKLGERFDLRDFHSRVLEIGPVQFPVLEKYLKQGYTGI